MTSTKPLAGDIPEGFIPDDVPEGFIPDGVPEGFIPDEAPSAFDAWAQAHKVKVDDPTYDYRAAFVAGEKPDERGHWTDKFKTPAHPTFSDQSLVGGGKKGGQWVKGKRPDQWEFRASPANLENQTPAQLMDYFDRVEPGNTIRFPDGSKYTPGDRGPVPFGDEADQVALDNIVSQTIERAQTGGTEKELEAGELAMALGMAPSDVMPSIEKFRATAKAMRENPRRWRQENPELFDLITRDPVLGATVMKDVTKWVDVITPNEEAFRAKHPWLAKLMPSLADHLNASGMDPGTDELTDGDGNVVARKETEQVRQQDMSRMSGNPVMQGIYAMGETGRRAYRENKLAKLGAARAYAEAYEYDGEPAKALREQSLLQKAFWVSKVGAESAPVEPTQAAEEIRKRIAEGRAEIGLPAFYGDGGVIKAVTSATEAVAGQTDSMGVLLIGGAIAVLGRSPKAGQLFTKVAGASTSFWTEMGGSYNNLVDTVDDQGKRVDRRVAFASAHLYGVLAAAVEVGALSIEMNGLKAYARSLVTDQTKRGALLSLFTKLTRNAAAEAGEEGAQSALEQTIEWLGKNASAIGVNDGGLQRANLPGALNEIGGSAGQGFVGGMLGVSLATMTIDAAHAMQNVSASRDAGARLAAIAEVAKTNAAQAAPRHVASWIASQQDKTGRRVTHLYVDPTKVVEQAIASGQRAEDVARELMGAEGPQRLQDALDLTADVPGSRATLEVPLAEYLEKWGAKPIAETLADHMTTFQGGQTIDELKLLQSDVDDIAGAMGDAADMADDEAMTAEEAAAQGTLEEQLIASGLDPREARLNSTTQAAFARVMSKRWKIPFSRFLSPTRLTVQGVDTEKPQAPRVQTTTKPPAPPTFKNVQDAYDSLINNADITGTADRAYNEWRNARPRRPKGKEKDKDIRKARREATKEWRSRKPAAFAGGTLDPVNEHLGLTGDKRVTGVREAFNRLIYREKGTFAERTREAIKVLRQVQGLENLQIPDEYMAALEDDRTDPNIITDPETGEQIDISFNFGPGFEESETLEQGDANAPASLAAISEAYGKMDPEEEGFVTYFADRNTGLLNRRGFEVAFKEMRTHEVIAAFGFEGAKYFNDEHGHGSVDGALRRMASAIKGYDAAKIGGEIFVIMPSESPGRGIAQAMRNAMPKGAEVTYGGAIKKRKTLQATLAAARDSLKGVRVVAEKSGFIAPRGELPAQFRGGQGSPTSTAQSLTETTQARFSQGLGFDHSAAFAADENKVATIYQDPSGLLSDDGFAAARQVNPKKFVMSADIRGFKGMNDAFSVEGTDAIKAWFNRSLHRLGGGIIDLANLHGDEYAAQHENAQAIKDWASDAQTAMRKVIIWEKSKDGSYVMQPGIHFAYGVAEDEDQADRVELKKFKEQQGAVGEIQRFATVEELIRGAEAYAQRLGSNDVVTIRSQSLIRGELQKGASGEASQESVRDQIARQAVEALEARKTQAELAADDEKNLVVIHNLTADNLLHAVELGALPAPSIGVSRVEQPLDSFGEISLLGGPELIDPKAGTPVFDADVYSPRWPDSEREVDTRRARALIRELEPFAEATGNRHMLEPSDLRKDDTADVVTSGAWVEILGAAYMAENKLDHDKPTPKSDSTEDKRAAGKEWAEWVRATVRSSDHREAYEKWALAKVAPALGERKIVRRSDSGRTRKLPYTLENILKEMTKKVRAGEQFNYGLGTARSFGAKKFTSIKQIQKARDRIVDHERFDDLKEENNEAFHELAAKLNKHHPAYKSGTSFGGLDAASMALGDSYRRGATARSALAANGYDVADMSAELVREFANFATELVAMPTQYFEAKPQRAVKLEEFKVAVVPNVETEQQLGVVRALRKAGLAIRFYERDETGDARREARQAAIQGAAEELQILFQKDDAKNPRGWVRIAKKGAEIQARIFLTKKSDASTFPHESAHAMFETMEAIAKDPRSPEGLRKDWAKLRKYVGAKDGEELTVAQKEKLARSWEAYLMEGKAPSAALAEVFYSFSRWLLEIYKSVAKLGVELNDDVRGVFDRMIATDREIELARDAAGLAPVASTPQEAGVDPKDFDAYLADKARSRTLVVNQTRRMIAEGQLRAAKAFKTDEFRKLVRRYESEYDALPESKAWRYLSMGEVVLPNGVIDRNTMRGKLSRNEVVNLLGADSRMLVRLKSRLNGTESAIDIAEQFGFTQGAADMLRRVAGLPAKEEWARQEAEREMRELHPEIDGEISNLQEAIQKLQHSDSLGEAERDWQTIKARTTDQVTLEALQLTAKRMVDDRLVGRIDPQNILNRERSFAQQAADAQLAGKFDEAMAFAHRRLLHKYLYKELMKARDDRESGLDLAADMADDESRKRLGRAGPEYRDVVDTILEALNIVGPRKQEEPRKRMDELMGRMALDGNSVAFDPILIGKLIAQPRKWQELKISEFREVVAALKNIRQGARNNTSDTIEGRRIDREETIAELEALAKENVPKNIKGLSTRQAGSAVDDVINFGRDVDGLLLRPETMLEELGWQPIIKMLQDAKYKRSGLLTEVVKPISEAFNKIPGKSRGRFREKIDGHALFPNHRQDLAAEGGGVPSRRYELFALFFNMGTESNQQRLLEGRGITREEVMRALSLLTREELAWAQSVLDQIESLWPQVRALEERDTGVAPEKLDATPIVVKSADGHDMVLRGGYFPAVYDERGDSLVGTKQALKSIADAMGMSNNGRPSTSRSHTKARAENFADAILLDPTVIQSHIVGVVQDLAFRETIRSVAGIMLDPRIRFILRQKLGEKRAKQFEPWLRDVGHGGATPVASLNGPEKVMRYLRGNVPMAVLGYNIRNALGDFTGGITAAIGTGLSKRHYMTGLVQFYLTKKDARAFAMSKSGELRSRSTDEESYRAFSRRMKALTQNRANQFAEAMASTAFYFQEQIEKTIATPIWLGAYNQGLAEGKGEEQAIDFADGIVRNALPVKDVVDKSGMQRDKGVLFGFMAMFTGFANQVYNQDRRIWRPVFAAEGMKDTALSAVAATLNHAALMLVVGIVSEFIVGHGQEPDEKWEQWFMRKLIAAHLMQIPLAGGAAEKWLLGGQASDRTNPGFVAIEQVGKALGVGWDLAVEGKGEPIDVFFSAIRALGYARGLPTGFPTKLLEYLADGDYDNQGGVASGMLYGERANGNQADNPIKWLDRALE